MTSIKNELRNARITRIKQSAAHFRATGAPASKEAPALLAGRTIKGWQIPTLLIRITPLEISSSIRRASTATFAGRSHLLYSRKSPIIPPYSTNPNRLRKHTAPRWLWSLARRHPLEPTKRSILTWQPPHSPSQWTITCTFADTLHEIPMVHRRI